MSADTFSVLGNDIVRFGRKAVQYLWDPLPRNQDTADIWCLGRRYESPFHIAGRETRPPGTSPSSKSDSSISQADSAVETPGKKATKPATVTATATADDDDLVVVSRTEEMAKSQADLTSAEEEALGWPAEFLDDLESRIWMTYRSNFVPIPKSAEPSAPASMSLSTRLRNMANQAGFTSDTGYGCMIRSGQSLLANALLDLRLGRDWRVGNQDKAHVDLLSLFADDPDAPFSIHNFVEHGAKACGKHPGEWFGPSATARCIQALTNKYQAAGLRVYARPDDGDVYADSLIATATQLSSSSSSSSSPTDFTPTLIVLGVRLGIDRVTPVYHAALTAALELPQSVGIAGGRPASSHYFIGHQDTAFFYLDPHATRPALPRHPTPADIATCHTRRLRRLPLAEMDPSMLLGFLVRSREDFENWRKAVADTPGKAIIHVHDSEPMYATGPPRASALDEVETWDETGGEEDET